MKKSSWAQRSRLAAWLESYLHGGSPRGKGESRKVSNAAARLRLEACEPRVVPAPVPVQTYFVPLPEADIRATFATLHSSTSSTINSVISIAGSSPNTILYYDHWEDGYDAGVASGNPSQASTRVWGDGNAANGIAPGFATDVVGAGSVVALQNQVPLPRNPGTVLYDGRDLIASTKAITVTRAAWATTPGTVLATAVDVYDVSKYGTSFIMPVGQDTGSANSMFEHSAIILSAADDNTVVTIDKDGPGGNGPNSVTLNKGQTYLVAGGVEQGATVTSTKPVQVQMMTGDIGAQYESRSYTIAPTNQWSNSYYNPVATTDTNDPTSVFLYNPNGAAITVTATTRTGSSTISVPANGSARYQMPTGSGASFSTLSPADEFYAVLASDSDADNATHDYGFRLVSESLLTPVVVVGWGPGSSDGTQNGSPVWVTPAAATRIYVDYDGNPATGPLTDGEGRKYDVHYDLAALESKRIFDPDKDQTAMRVYTRDGVRLAAAWGQDPATAGPGNPFLDMGTTVLPLPVSSVSKTAAKVGGAGPVGPGDTIRYTITVRNDGVVVLGNVIVNDIVPLHTSYVAGSVKVNNISVPDQTVGGSINTAFPLDNDGAGDVGLAVGNIAVANVAVVTFDVVVSNPYTGTAAGITNDAVVESDGDVFRVSVTTPTPNNQGQVIFATVLGGAVEAQNYPTNTTTFLTLTDADVNRNASVAETVTVTVTSPTGDSEVVTLTESGVNTGVFRAVLPSSTTASAANSGTIHVLNGQTLTVNYQDPLYLFETDSDTVPIVAVVQNPPVNTVPGSQAATQGLPVPVSVSVADANTNLASTQLTVTGGVLNVTPSGATVSGNGTGTVSISGTQAQINAALATLTYTANYGVTSDTLTVLSTDATSLTDSDTVPITVPSVLKQLYLSNEDASNVTVSGAQNLDRYDPTKSTPQTEGAAVSSVTLSTSGGSGTVAIADTIPATASTANNVSSLTINNYSTGSGSNKLLLVGISIGNGGSSGTPPTVSSITYGGANLSLVGTQLSGPTDTDARVYIYSLVNPAAGPANIVITMSGTGDIVARALTFTGVDQTTPLGSFQTARADQPSGSATSASIGYTGSSSGELVFSVLSIDSGPAVTIGSGQTTVYNGATSDISGAASYEAGGGGTVTSTYTANDNQEWVIGAVAIRPAPAGGIATTTFSQSTPLAAALTLPAGQPVNVISTVTVTGGTMPASPNITATLRHGGTTIATLTNPTFSGGVLTWTTTLGSAVTIPSGAVISLDVTTAQAGVNFQLTYDASTGTTSRIELPASPVIDVTNVEVRDAANGGGSAITQAIAGETVYVRATVTDPFGHHDVSGGLLTITPTTGGSPITLTSSHVVSQSGNTKVYEYAWATTDSGNFVVSVRGNEGYEGTVFDTATTPFNVTQQDLGTPSISAFTTSNNGPTTTTYPAGVNPVFVRVTDIDQNTNPGTVETITATVTSSTGDSVTVTLTETGPNTGIFTASVPTEAALVTGNGNLHAPNGSTLNIAYTDPTDPTDQSSASAVVGTPVQAPDAVNDTGSVNEDTPLVVGGPGVLTNDTTPGGTTPITVVALNGTPFTTTTTVTLPSGAILTLDPNGSYTYNPNGVFNHLDAGQTTTDSFTYTIRNNTGGVDTATVTITINGANDAPTTGDSTFTVVRNGTYQLGDFAFPFADPDLTDTLQSVTITSLPTDGTLQLSGTPVGLNQVIPAAQLANLTFQPDNNEVGRPLTSFTFTVSDGTASSAPGTVTFNVIAPPAVDLNGPDAGTGFSSTFITGGGAVSVTDSDAVVTDDDDTAMAWLSLTVGGVADGNSEVLRLGTTDFPLATDAATTVTAGGTTFAVTYTAATGTFSLTRSGGGDMPQADIDLLLRGMTYRDAAAVPTNGPRTIAVQTNDGDFSSNVATATVTVAPAIGVSDVTVAEGDGFAVFTVSLSNPSAEDVTFSLALADGTALGAGTDYGPGLEVFVGGVWVPATSATIPAGATGILVRTPITDDSLDELNETFTLTATVTSGTTANPADSGTGTITDNDPAPTYTIDDVTVNEGAGTMTFTVTLTGDTALTSTVNHATASNTATSGADFTSTSGTLTFGPGTGTRTQTITVPISNDSLYEKSESFFLNLSNATEATISDSQGVGTILDDGTNIGGFANDDRPRYTVNDVTVNESAGTLTFTVTLTGSTALPSSVQYATAPGSAGAGDFTGASGTLNFPAGSGARTQTVTVPITNDSVPEGTEQFFLNLSGPVEATISDGQGVGTILDDDASVTATKSAALFTDADGTGDVSPGDTLRYTVVLTNPSGVAATGVRLTDLLPDVDLALVPGSVTTTQGAVTTGNSAGNTTVVVNVGTLLGGASATIQFRARVANPLTGGDTQVVNQAAATGSNFVTTPTDDPGTAAPGDPTVMAVNVPARLSGVVYRDNGDGVFGAGDTGISGVTLTLTGTTSAGVPITRTAVSNASGSYSFAVPPSNAGGYTITQAEPALYQDRAVNVGTLSGSGSMVAGGNDSVSGIVAAAGATGTGYNFAETNLPPVVNVGADLSATFCGVFNFQRPAFFTDAAQDGSWTGTVDYGDNTGVKALALSPSNTFQLSHTYTRGGLYNVVVTIRDSFGQSTATQMLVAANRQLPQAFGQLVTFNDGSAQRSMVNQITVTFNQVMLLDSGAFQVQTKAGANVPVRTVERVINGKTVVVLEFTGSLMGGSLADGNYRVLINGSKVRTLAGAVWNGGGVYSESFYRYFGDSDGDRDVDNIDLAAIQAALRSTRGTSAYRDYFDSDADCDVDATDYNQFLARYRRTLAP